MLQLYICEWNTECDEFRPLGNLALVGKLRRWVVLGANYSVLSVVIIRDRSNFLSNESLSPLLIPPPLHPPTYHEAPTTAQHDRDFTEFEADA